MGDFRSSISEKMEDFHEKDNILEFRVAPITGTKEPPNGDWLSELPLNTTFLAKTISFTPVFNEYTIMGKREQAILLRENRRQGGEDASNWDWHDPVIFCRKNEKVEIL